jgi:Zn ribbon nucleic-acid-binding protein
MPEYTCPKCKQGSYSAAREEDLIDPSCPYCGHDPRKKQNPIIKDTRRLVRRLMGGYPPVVYIKGALLFGGVILLMSVEGGVYLGTMTATHGIVQSIVGLGLVAGAVG